MRLSTGAQGGRERERDARIIMSRPLKILDGSGKEESKRERERE